MKQFASFRASPARLLLASILGTIAGGAVLLCLPMCQVVATSLADNIFTAVSATCVTGLLTVPITNYTTLGHIVILCLMQIGGLGMITMTLFLMSFFVELGLGTQLMAGQLLELESWRNIKKILTFIICMTLTVESCGALLTWLSIREQFPLGHALFVSVFHAVSAFCDAGFTLFPGGFPAYYANLPLLLTTIILMVIGGLGFITFHELLAFCMPSHQRRRPYFSLQTRIVLWTTAVLILGSVILFWLLERTNGCSEMNGLTLFVNVLFNAVGARSPGFNTINPIHMHSATIFIIMIVSFIGSSPGSTGSGIKTTTVALFLATVRTALAGHASVSLDGRSIARDQVFKAIAVIALSLGLIACITFLLLVTEQTLDPFALVFEVVSAFATLGLSLNITSQLSLWGKFLIMCTMIVGRVGALTTVIALRRRSDMNDLAYPEERVMVG